VNWIASPPRAHALPSVDPAFDLAVLLDELDASVFPAFERTTFVDLDDRDDFAIGIPLHLKPRQKHPRKFHQLA